MISKMKLSHEIVEKIKSANSADEVLAIAKECNVEITPEEANKYFHQLHSGELDDDLLDGVSGGWVIMDDTEEPTYERIGKSSRSQCR